MGKLLAGVASRDITPDAEMLELIKNTTNYKYDGIYNRMSVKVLVLTDGQRRFVYVCNDLSYMTLNDDLREALADLGVELKDCFFSGTRCHNGVSGWQDKRFDEMDEGHKAYGKMYLKALVESIREAAATVRPARIGGIVVDSWINTFREQYTEIGNFESMAHNGPRAPWLRVVRVEDTEGRTMCVLANYCMQNCSLYWNSHYGQFPYFASDVAGQIIDYVEKAGKHQFPLMWSCGAGQDQQAITYSLMDKMEVNDAGEFYYVHDYMPIDANLKLMRFYACEQGQDILRAMGKIEHYSDEFVYWSDEEKIDVPSRKPFGHPPMVFDPKTTNVKPTQGEKPIPFRFKLAVIDGIAFCAVNGRCFSEIYKKVADLMPFETTVFFDDCFGSVGGIAPPKYEENPLNCHASLQTDTYTMRMSYGACFTGFNNLLNRYMLDTNERYGGAPYPVET